MRQRLPMKSPTRIPLFILLLLALIVAARRGALGRVVRSSGGVAATLLAGLAMRADLKSLPTLETEGAIRIPYGVPIALGAVFGLVA